MSHSSSHLCFYFVSDNLGFELKSTEILNSWINKHNRESLAVLEPKSLSDSHLVTNKAYLVLPPLSKLILSDAVEAIIDTIKQAKNNSNIQQLFIWVTLKNIQHHFIVPFVVHLADIVLTFDNERNLNILTKKSSGSVTRKRYQYQVDLQSKNFNVKEIELSKVKRQDDQPSIDPHSLATFKIGNLSVSEQKARAEVLMPYEK